MYIYLILVERKSAAKRRLLICGGSIEDQPSEKIK